MIIKIAQFRLGYQKKATPSRQIKSRSDFIGGLQIISIDIV